MSVVPAWSPFFQSRTRIRGRAYQMDGRVTRLMPEDGELIRAEVRGTKTYTVRICRNGRYAAAECDCPAYEQGAYCKHIWATLLDVQHSEGGPGVALEELARFKVRAPKARKRDDAARPIEAQQEPDWIGRLSLLRPPLFDQPLLGSWASDAAPDTTDSSGGGGDLLLMQRQVCYVVLPKTSVRHGGLVVELRQRTPIASGWSKPRPLKINRDMLSTLVDPADRELCALVIGAQRIDPDYAGDPFGGNRAHACFCLPLGARRNLIRQMIDTGRCFIDLDEDGSGEEYPLQQSRPRNENEPGVTEAKEWTLWIVATRSEDELLVNVELRRNEQRLTIDQPQLILGGADGLLFHEGKVSYFDDRDSFRWVSLFRDDLRRHGRIKPIRVPLSDVDRFLDRLYMLPQLPEIELPPGIGRQEQHVRPVYHLDLFSAGSAQAMRVLGGNGAKQQLAAQVWFDYGGQRVSPLQPGRFLTLNASSPDAEQSQQESRLIRRDQRGEREAFSQLSAAGLRPASGAPGDVMLLNAKQMPMAVSSLIAQGWTVLADQRLIRRSSAPNLVITSGIDWFELRGGVSFTREDGSEQLVTLPQILRAARSGQTMIELGDGSQALLPETWLAEHGMLTALGKVESDHLRFGSSQAAMLDVLLRDTRIEATDEKFEQMRLRLREFNGIKAIEAPSSFQGTLRAYQKDGLGWFGFLRWFATGGVLADDMGLGKTIQVLALLLHRREMDKPSLVVAPRSVVFNWIDEAQRFAPMLRVMAYTGADRAALRDNFRGHDLIVTSYGLMRRDVEELGQHEFDYIVLDEAQAIKNPTSQSAKAARLLRAENRLALTGTPVENHLGDLWSIFEFLNPGMLGASNRFNDLIRATAQQNNGAREAAIMQIAAALRPFILRRTKKQVLADLPEKTEQTIVCEMEPAQRETYDQMRLYYRAHLLHQLDRGTPGSDAATESSSRVVRDAVSAGGGTFMVLEALLRLRQIACHPGLIDEKRADDGSAKLDVLLENLEEVIDEGHKALVFSQFTSMLALVRRRLDAAGIEYCYLDGQTRDRKSVVEQFQTDPHKPVFLISLKAGGFGLNLTAAEYVFILDPWWNPAVEQQAIDRTHRIGQTRRVFAYRLICQDTVEQRIIELQQRKRKLADAIVGGEENLLRTLTRDDLEMLLS
ncbi:MAG: SWIM zinc finger family protein [Phycisphaeraceae bacterium]|nr:SWIM zinc finger family protein [Phycisphaeraceae bacterium]